MIEIRLPRFKWKKSDISNSVYEMWNARIKVKGKYIRMAFVEKHKVSDSYKIYIYFPAWLTIEDYNCESRRTSSNLKTAKAKAVSMVS